MIFKIIFTLILLEIVSYFIINYLRKDFQWLITSKDETPELSKEGLNKFFTHGWDSKLGWIRKPNTSKTEISKIGTSTFNINEKGSRLNPGHENLPIKISCYGDSFTFARQVNDNQTFSWQLSELTKSNVLNFGVGNYGLDQSLLRLKKEFPKIKSETVIMGVVPSTIVRVLCIWKHYNEFGNTFGFKPRYIIENNELKLINNIINTKDKFYNYTQYLDEIKKYDSFYETKFKKEMIKFPYLFSILKKRNLKLIYSVTKYKFNKKEIGGYPEPMKVIMDINRKLRVDLYNDKNAVNLMTKLVQEFKSYAKKQNFTPIFLWMPQKDDITYIQENSNFYSEFIDKIKNNIKVVDLTQELLNYPNLNELFSDDNQYGGHFSVKGNKLVADILKKAI